ncbi:hypothetical protein MKX01_022870 [Papaver californicum]|nr:hypothetical protein MKX01_022870 [Papaver californicum]
MEKFILKMASEKPIRFTTQELHSFSNNYTTRLGSGGFGVVYSLWQKIIHYDIKPGKVLLDQYFLPKVADFGLAKLCNRESTHVSFTGYRGTPGYSAPEFFLHNYPITHKCDVYSFGMLLFEMVTRQRNFQTHPVSEIIDRFPKKAWEECEKGRLRDLIVQIGIEEKDKEEAERMFMTAFCNVVKMLEGGVEILPPSNPFRYLYALDPTDVVIDSYTTSTRIQHQL